MANRKKPRGTKFARRVARSAECSTAGRSPTEPEVIRSLVLRARAAGVVVFLRDELERMPWQARELIEAEAKRLRSGN